MESKPLASESNFDDVLSRIGFGRYQIVLFIAMSFRTFCFGSELVTLAAYQKYLIEEEDLSDISIEFILTLIVLGQAIGFLIGGINADKAGRLTIVKIAYLLIFISGILSSFFQSYFIFAPLRFITNLGIGLVFPVGTAYSIESSPINTRGIIGTLFLLFFAAGQGFNLLLVYIFMNDFNGDNWTIVFGTSPFLGIFAIMLLFFYLKESPWFLLRRGQTSAGIDVAEYISQQNTGKELDNKEIEIATQVQPLFQNRFWLYIIFDSNHLKRTLIFTWLMIVSSIGYMTPIYLFPLLLDDNNFYTVSLLSIIGIIPFLVIVMFVIERKEFGRKVTLTIGYSVIAVSCFICCWFASSDVVIGIAIGIVSGLAFVLFNTQSQFLLEQYETEIRSTSLMTINMISRAFTIPLPIIIAEISSNNLYPLIIYIVLYVSAAFSILGIKNDTTGKHLDNKYD